MFFSRQGGLAFYINLDQKVNSGEDILAKCRKCREECRKPHTKCWKTDGQEGTPEGPEVMRLEWIAEESAESMAYIVYNSTVPSVIVGEA